MNRLNRLREEGWVDRHGESRATVYVLADAGRRGLEAVSRAQQTGRDSLVSLSEHAELSRRKLRHPVSERLPVGYQRAFLDSYQPNQTFYLPPAIPDLIESHFDLILAKVREIHDPYEQSFFAMVHLPYLQPFLDGNKRVSRLAANLPLFRRNFARYRIRPSEFDAWHALWKKP